MGAINKKLIQTVVSTSVMIIVAFLVKQIFFNPSVDKELTRFANELNKNCPIMADGETRLDNAIALPPKIFQYNYTLINMDGDSVDVAGMKNSAEPIIINKVKTNPDMKVFRDNKVTVAYNYQDRNGRFLMKITVTPDQYSD